MNDMSDEDKKITGELPAAKPVKAEKQNPPILTKEESKEDKQSVMSTSARTASPTG